VAGLGYNLLVFDQRGIAFSRPQESLYQNLDFYSSLNTALDLEEIRKKLGLQQLIIYGASYGTVPATIYSSLFPERVLFAILEGTFYTEMAKASHLQVVDASIAKLGSKAKWLAQNLTEPSVEFPFGSMWLPTLVKVHLQVGGLTALQELDKILESAPSSLEEAKPFLNSLFAKFADHRNEIESGDDFVNLVISAKELSMFSPEVSEVIKLDKN
jgi:proline iminopeptidase